MKKNTVNSKTSFRQVFQILQKLTLTPFENGLMMSLITRMIKHGQFNSKVHAYTLRYQPSALATNDDDSLPQIKKSFRDFQKKGYLKVMELNHQKRFSLTFVQIDK